MRLFSRETEFELAVSPELPVMYRFAYRLTHSKDDAEDLVQQTLLQALRGWRSFDGKHLRSWLLRIMRNANANRLRHAGVRPDTVNFECEVSDDGAFWDAALWRDQAHRILEEMDKLPAEYAGVVHLCDVEEMTYEEAAEALDVPVGTIKSRLSRGRAMLRMLVSPQSPLVEGAEWP